MQIHASGTLLCRQRDIRLSTNLVIRAPPCVPGEDVVGPS
jgi:hypothetical protein